MNRTSGSPRNPESSAVLELVEVMDRLRSPGGCPWDAEQTHESLAPYVVEEAYELTEAIASGDRTHIAEELGDVLLQVVFHARVAQEEPDGFDIDDVARLIVEKLRRRHPHVFAEVAVTGAAEVEANWDAIKAAEKPERTGPLDGIPAGMPPLERAAKVLARLDRLGMGADIGIGVGIGIGTGAISATGAGAREGEGADMTTELDNGVGERMLALVAEARAAGLDPAAEFRGALTRLERRLPPTAG